MPAEFILADVLNRRLEPRRLIGIGQTPAGGGDAGEQRNVRANAVQPIVQEACPVIRLNGIERTDDVLEGVGMGDKAAVVHAEKSASEIVNGTPIVAQRSDFRV